MNRSLPYLKDLHCGATIHLKDLHCGAITQLKDLHCGAIIHLKDLQCGATIQASSNVGHYHFDVAMCGLYHFIP